MIELAKMSKIDKTMTYLFIFIYLFHLHQHSILLKSAIIKSKIALQL